MTACVIQVIRCEGGDHETYELYTLLYLIIAKQHLYGMSDLLHHILFIFNTTLDLKNRTASLVTEKRREVLNLLDPGLYLYHSNCRTNRVRYLNHNLI